MLPLDDWVSREIRDVGSSDLSSRLEKHPSNVGVPKSLVSVVRIELSVGVSVVSSVSSRPPFDRSFNGSGSSSGEEVLKGRVGVVGSVSPQSMVTSSDSETGDEVVNHTPDGSLGLEGGGEDTEESDGGGNREDEERNPLNVLKQSRESDGRKDLLLVEGVLNVVIGYVRVDGLLGDLGSLQGGQDRLIVIEVGGFRLRRERWTERSVSGRSAMARLLVHLRERERGGKRERGRGRREGRGGNRTKREGRG